jgi:DNA-binding SARP family transcriptional activator/tetratricopeptide (TPR) repeat protein
MAHLDLTLLGGFGARVDTRVLVFPSRKARALLAYLAVPIGRSHSRDKLAALLWGDTAEPQARNSLRQCLFGIRRILVGHRVRALVVDGESVALDQTAVRVDVAAFDRLVTEGTMASLSRARSLYHGPFLDGLILREPGFEDWLMAERRMLHDRAAQAFARLIDRFIETGAIDQAIQTGLDLVALDPLSEPAHCTVMRLHAALGHRGAALRQYQACADVLRRELGVEPDVATQRLYREILRQTEAAPGSSPEWSADSTAASPGRTSAPLAGRAVELDRLHEAATAAQRGHGRVVVLLGEAGIGKSRLVEETLATTGAHGWRVIVGRSYETEQMLALGVWAGAFRAAGLTVRRDAVADLGAAWRAELARLLPDLADPDARAPRPSGSELRLFEAVARWLERLAAASPLLVVLEDLHWADEASLRLTAFLARRLERRPVLMVVTARIEEIGGDAPMLGRVLAELSREQRVTEIALGPLGRSATGDLVRGLLARGTAETELDALGEQVWRISEGNPFIVVETVQARQEGLLLEADAGAALPTRARAMLLGRVDRLGERSRGLLEVAAVIGRDFEFSLVQRAAGMDEAAAATALEELVRRRLVHGVGERFDFTHDRIWEVVYAQLSPVRRRLLHTAVARAIESLHAADLATRHAALGVHWTKGEVWDRAIAHLRAAGTQAASRGAYREAVALFEQALAAVGRLPEDRDTVAQGVDLRIELRDWLMPLGEQDRLARYAREAEQLALRHADHHRLAVIIGHLAHHHWTMGEQDLAMEYANRMLVLAERLGDPSLRTAGSFYLGEACHAVGDVRRAVEVLRENAALTGPRMVERVAGPGLVPIMSRVWRAIALCELGRFDEALRLVEEALPVVEALEHPYSLMRVHDGIGAVHAARGRLAQAVPALERAAALVERWDIAFDRQQNASALGIAYMRSGRHEDGLALLERSVERLFPPRASSILSRRLGEATCSRGATMTRSNGRRRRSIMRDGAARGATRPGLCSCSVISSPGRPHPGPMKRSCVTRARAPGPMSWACCRCSRAAIWPSAGGTGAPVTCRGLAPRSASRSGSRAAWIWASGVPRPRPHWPGSRRRRRRARLELAVRPWLESAIRRPPWRSARAR